ncbi:phage tail protein [Ralstonia sp. L16]|uniref:phage tail protein n=1 Tax=Ralstonia sp. L16 TaxID=3423950 RepID=UPI003F790DDA
MAIDTFTWIPLVDPQGTTNYRTRKAQFGDGYDQEVPDGINNAVDSWPLSFRDTGAVIAQIKAFLDAHGGSRAFYWTPPLGVQGYFKAASCQVQPSGKDVYTLTTTFQQVFRP